MTLALATDPDQVAPFTLTPLLSIALLYIAAVYCGTRLAYRIWDRLHPDPQPPSYEQSPFIDGAGVLTYTDQREEES